MRVLVLLSLCLLAVLPACAGCRTGQVRSATGELAVAFPLDDTTVLAREGIVDFGPVFMEADKSVRLSVKNLGLGSLVLRELVADEGSGLTVGAEPTAEAPFAVTFEPVTLGGGESTELELVFRAPRSELPVTSHQATFRLRAENTRPDEDTATVTLRALAVSRDCQAFPALEFGPVVVGEQRLLSARLWNTTDHPVVARIDEPSSAGHDHLAFSFSPSSARGDTPLAPGESREVSLEFRPSEHRAYRASLRVRASERCPEFEVSLTGHGVENIVTWEPTRLDFGFVTPGTVATRELRFRNAGDLDARLSAWAMTNAEFFVATPNAPLVVPARGTSTLSVSFKPTALGPRTGRLSFRTDLARQAQGEVPLAGFGGGPDIQVSPYPTLNLGRIAYFSGQSPTVRRRVTVMNVGTRMSPPDPRVNLRLGRGGSGAPHFELRAEPPLLDTREVSVSFASPYAEAKGLEATAGQNRVDLLVEVTPTSLGPKRWTLVIFSNDPDESEVEVSITADAVALPPCNYSVSPVALNFGVVTPPGQRDLAFTVRNESQTQGDVCLFSVELDKASDALFSLPQNDPSQRELQPGQSIVVPVRAAATGTTGGLAVANGKALVSASSPTRPTTEVALTAALTAGCLKLSPEEIDFGTVKTGCGSSTRTVQLYNGCAAPLVLTSLSLVSAAGQPAGGPDCPGTQPCPEFRLVTAPAIPGAGLTLNPGATPVTLSAKYSPLDLGPDYGAVAIHATHAGQSATYLVTLKGRGDPTGLNTDVFRQGNAKADILLVIDNSGSMLNEQRAIADNFAAFIAYATRERIDYQLGVTTTDMRPGYAQGRLVTGPSHPEKVLTPATVDLENKFKAKVRVGATGSNEELVFEATRSALISMAPSANAGFLRPDATLAVIAVTDELEQSSDSVNSYLAKFLSVKGAHRPGWFTFNAIAGFNVRPSASCDAEQDDGRLASMVARSHGVRESICTANWALALERLGTIAFGHRTTFFLNGMPDLAGGRTLEVRIDGVVVPSAGLAGSSNWTYDAATNSVTFAEAVAPKAGQAVSVTYLVACLAP